ncbi:hypothetical protein CH379_018565 [Leptospira ellisii]|uniref:Uncharacterized protein n=1 Tax=Leptospira ellisii TaxID=2023197 RepID=A0A2N0B313_9LEPT|nr:hypothetical protein [Leptospira ellisii]MDV6237641.1 hypothetical protein [Leptospira ellisii]PJZ90903.1 hypothetical protein CH379_21690 [Leptospira ellisii]PKA04293.1 hypothetical protein CH375_11865 [Leptospira ellisii]
MKNARLYIVFLIFLGIKNVLAESKKIISSKYTENPSAYYALCLKKVDILKEPTFNSTKIYECKEGDIIRYIGNQFLEVMEFNSSSKKEEKQFFTILKIEDTEKNMGYISDSDSVYLTKDKSFIENNKNSIILLNDIQKMVGGAYRDLNGPFLESDFNNLQFVITYDVNNGNKISFSKIIKMNKNEFELSNVDSTIILKKKTPDSVELSIIRGANNLKPFAKILRKIKS